MIWLPGFSSSPFHRCSGWRRARSFTSRLPPNSITAAPVSSAGSREVRALVVISAGRSRDPQRRGRLLASVCRYGMSVVGPSSVGVSNSDSSVCLDATFAPSPASIPEIARCAPRWRTVQNDLLKAGQWFWGVGQPR